MFYRISRAGFGTALFSCVKSKLSFFKLDNILFPHAAMIAGGMACSFLAFTTAADAQITMPIEAGSNGVFFGDLMVNGADIGDWAFTTQTANVAAPAVQVPGGDLQSDGTGLSYDHNRREQTWNLDATLGVELDSTAFDATGFKYVLVLEGNSGRGDAFGARFDEYTVTAPGASGAPAKVDPAYPINGVVPLLSFPGQLSNLSAVPGGVTFQQPIINVQNLADFQASLPGATHAHLDAVIAERCIAGNSGAWRNNCLDWQVRTPSFDGDGNLRLEAINGASREGFRFSLLSEADLAVNKTIDGMDSGVVLSVGSTANYVITVTHAGGLSASSASLVSLRDVLPVEVTLNGTATASQGSYDPATQVWTIGTLQIGESVTLTLPFEVTGGNSGDTVTNAISLSDVSMLQTDTNPANNETSVGFTIGAEIDANPETFSDIDSASGGVTTSVLGSDTFDGGAATLSNVTITAPVAADYTNADGDPVVGLSLDPTTGLISVSAGTPAGTYKISYEICAQDLSSNCATTVETIVVTSSDVPPITNPGPQPGRCFPTSLNMSGGALFDAAVISAANGTGTHTPESQLATSIVGADISHLFPGFPAGSVIVDANYNRRNGSSIGVGLTASPPTATFTLSGTHPTYIEPQHGKALRPGDTDGFRALDGVEYALISSLAPSVYTAYRNGNEYGVSRPASNSGALPAQQVRWSSVTPATQFEIFTTEPDDNNNAAMFLAPTCTTSINTTKAATTVGSRNADGTFDVTYVITVENLSNINLRNMVVTDDLAAQFGAAFVSVVSAPVVSPVGTLSAESSGLTGSSAWVGDGANMLAANGQLGTGDAINVTFTVRIDPAATSATAFENTATASGDRPDGTRISDKSDDVTDGGTGTPDEDTGTPTSVTAPTEVVATDDAETIDRSAADAGATGVLNLFDGDTVNGDPADATNATVVPVDPTSVPGELTVNPDGSVDVKPGTAPGVYSFDYQLCSLDTVPVCETATATITVTPEIEAVAETFPDFTQAGGDTTSILSSDTLNGATADLTTVNITAPVAADITKVGGGTVSGISLDPATGIITVAAGTDAGTYSVAYEICTIALPVTCDTAVETVTVQPSEVVPADDAETIDRSAADAGATGVLNLFDGDTINGDPADTTNATVVPVDPASVPGELTVNPDGSVDVNPGTAPGVYSFDYQLCSLDTVPVCETATATITVTPEIEAAPETFDTFGPAGGTTSSILASDTLNGETADLSTVDITAPVPGDYKDASGQPVTGLTLDPATGLITIDPGLAAGDYFVDYEICTKAAPVTCSTTTETITIGVPKLILTLESGTLGTDGGTDPSVTDPGDTVPYILTVTNDGDVTMEDIIITSGDLNNIICNPTTLAPGEMATCTADPHVITVDDFNTGGIEKTATVTGISTAGPAEDVSDTRNGGGSETSDDPDLEGNTDGDPTSDPTIVPLVPLAAEAGAITVSKTANLSLVNYGDTVTYTLVYENTSALNIADLDLLDELPGGLAYTPGTAELDGVATEPSVAGRRLTWSGVDIAAGASVEVTLAARVLPDSATEELVNSAWATQDSDVVSNIGTATIRIRPEHVFHCSDVIGKVFDDRNGNGIQDGPDSLAGLTDQTYTSGKFESAPAAENRGEPGLSGVRLVTVNGHLITTDAYGRFHVPCAALPADGGSNFTLKVDTRTLPSGYRMTTENPRVLRLTAGRFGRMNFGAAIADVARIDLDATAFATDQNGRPVAIPALDQALRAMLNDPANPVSVVHLRYHRAGSERPRTARRHLDLVEDILNDAWTGQSGTRLLVERETLRLNP